MHRSKMTRNLVVILVLAGLILPASATPILGAGDGPPRQAYELNSQPVPTGPDRAPFSPSLEMDPKLLPPEAPKVEVAFGQPSLPQVRRQRVQAADLLWRFETVDNEGDVGEYPSMQWDGDGYLNAVYYDRDDGTINYGYRDLDGSGWHTSVFDTDEKDVGMYPSLAMDDNEWPHAAYYGVDEKVLWYSYWDGSQVLRELVDSGDVGEYASLKLDSGGTPHIGYYDGGNGNPKYAYRQGTNDWVVETVDSGPNNAGWYTSIALDSSDLPHIAYYDTAADELLYAYHDGATWRHDTIDSAGNVGVECSLVLDRYDIAHVSYWDWDNESLKYAYYTGAVWKTETVDTAGNTGRYSSLQIDGYDEPHISYHRFDLGDLMYAYHTGSGWQIETVATKGTTGIDTSLTFDAAGYPHIGFYDGSEGAFKVAVGGELNSMEDAPQDLYRRAAQHLEEMRDSGLAPGWVDAELSEIPTPLYRLDREGIAYYEFAVTAPSLSVQDSEDAGFIELAVEGHDYPLSHWSDNGESPTQELARLALEDSEDAETFFKLDAMAYVAENSSGDQVASIGTLPAKQVGFDPAWLEGEDQKQTSTWTPNESVPDDSDVGEAGGSVTTEGDDPPEGFSLEDWGSWQDMKDDYGANLDAHLDQLDTLSGEAWDTERTINDTGLVLYEGDSYGKGLLYEHGTARLSGDGADYVQQAVMVRAGLLPILNITVVGTPAEPEPLRVTVEYNNGVVDISNFVIGVERPVLGYKVFLPLVLKSVVPGSGGQALSAAPPREVQATLRTQQLASERFAAAQQAEGTPFYWVPWYATPNRKDMITAYFDQRWYRQLGPHTPPNTTGCYSGCGATAWAMLFGWADYRASQGDPVWAHRKGLYRQGGGHQTADIFTVAPVNMANATPESSGIKSIIWEMRGMLQTFCVGDQGATHPWTMIRAANYLATRTGAQLRSEGSLIGWRWSSHYRDRAVWSIQGRGTPAIISQGWFAGGHYPLAMGVHWRYREKCHWWSFNLLCTLEDDYTFWVNTGNSGWDGTKWVRKDDYLPQSIFFVGELWPDSVLY